jgi:hypothetical protein
MKLVLMTATPMYNNYKEIIFLLNLLLKNDKRIELTESDIFKPNSDFQEGGEENWEMRQRPISVSCAVRIRFPFLCVFFQRR